MRALLLGAPQDKLNALFTQLLPYEKQLALVYAWFPKMFEIVESADEETAKEARVALETLLLRNVSRLLGLALGKKESDAKQWAGRLLASIARSIAKHDEERGKHAKELSKTNAGYLAEKAKIGKLRVDVVFPAPISKAVQQELRTAERYRSTLLLCRCVTAGGENLWKRIAKRQRVPEEYFGTVDLLDFSVESEPQWWKFLWPLIKKHVPQGSWYQRPPGHQPRKRYSSDFQKAGREHLQALARLRDAGILY
jgi:hypothetical protein